MSNYNVADDFSANDFVSDRLLHFLDLDKVDDSAWDKSDTKLIEEVQYVSEVIYIGSHGQDVDAHEQLQDDQNHSLDKGVSNHCSNDQRKENLSDVVNTWHVLPPD